MTLKVQRARLLNAFPQSQVLASTVSLGLFAGAMLIVRQRMIFTGAVLNPDEAELLASGKLAMNSLFVPFGEYAATTNWFLWPMALGFLGRFGVPLDLRTAHLLTAGFYVLFGWGTWRIFSRSLGQIRSMVCVLPSFLYVASLEGDFLSMGSELFPLAIVMLAALVVFNSDEAPTTPKIFFIGLVLGLVPWAKIQITPIAGSLLIVASLFSYFSHLDQEQSVRQRMFAFKLFIASAGGFLLPSVLFVVWIRMVGTMDEFAREGLGFVFNYVTENPRDNAIPIHQRPRNGFEFANQYLPVMGWSLFGLLASSEATKRNVFHRARLLVWALPICVGYLTLVVVVPPFSHYANILILASSISGMSALAIGRWLFNPNENRSNLKNYPHVSWSSAVALLVMSVLSLSTGYNRWLGVEDANLANAMTSVALYKSDSLSSLCPSGSVVQVWGWSSELYSFYGWQPATRFPNNVAQLVGDYEVRETRISFVDQIQDSRPKCIVEALGADFFAQIDPSLTIVRVIPEVVPLIERCYSSSNVMLADSREAKVWKLRDCKGS